MASGSDAKDGGRRILFVDANEDRKVILQRSLLSWRSVARGKSLFDRTELGPNSKGALSE